LVSGRLVGYDLFMLKMEMEEEGFIPHGINIGKTVLTLEDDSEFINNNNINITFQY
jgi:hypothetical protein